MKLPARVENFINAEEEWKPIGFAVFVATGITFVVVLALTYLARRYFHGESAESLYLWVQMASALSGPDMKWLKEHFNELLFSIAATSHIVLNIAPFTAIIFFGIKLLRNSGRTLMNLAKAFALRDAELEASIENIALSRIESEDDKAAFRTELKKVFENANEHWKQQLKTFIGAKAAEEIVAKVELELAR